VTKPAADASVGELMVQLSSQTSRLVRDELRLAQKELQQSAKHAGIGAGLFSVTGLFAAFALAAIVTAGIAALSLVLQVWAAALIVAALLLVAAGIAALIGKSQVQHAASTPQAVDNVKKDLQEVNEARHDHT
jgi:Flp pilus assembly protein TadB